MFDRSKTDEELRVREVESVDDLRRVSASAVAVKAIRGTPRAARERRELQYSG